MVESEFVQPYLLSVGYPTADLSLQLGEDDPSLPNADQI
jgi:hypothetical protein